LYEWNIVELYSRVCCFPSENSIIGVMFVSYRMLYRILNKLSRTAEIIVTQFEF